jgi:hypothetical protein
VLLLSLLALVLPLYVVNLPDVFDLTMWLSLLVLLFLLLIPVIKL